MRGTANVVVVFLGFENIFAKEHNAVNVFKALEKKFPFTYICFKERDYIFTADKTSFGDKNNSETLHDFRKMDIKYNGEKDVLFESEVLYKGEPLDEDYYCDNVYENNVFDLPISEDSISLISDYVFDDELFNFEELSKLLFNS